MFVRSAARFTNAGVRAVHTQTARTATKPAFARSSSLMLVGLLSVATASSYYAYNAASPSAVSSVLQTAHADAPQPETEAQGKQGLSPKEFKKFTVKEVKPYNYNSNIIVFDVEDPNKPLNLPCTSFIMTQANIDGKPVQRPYTPIDQNEPGVLNLLVKKYPTGAMSSHIHSLKQGDQLEIKGPLPKLKYEPGTYQAIGMVAGGSGITPMAQLIEEVTRNPNDKTKLTLLFANVSPKDILLREKFDAIAVKNKDKFRVIYIVDKDAEPGMVKGRVSADILKKYLPAPDQNGQVLVCGPLPMMEAVSGNKAKDYTQGELSGLLKQMGYKKEQVYKF